MDKSTTEEEGFGNYSGGYYSVEIGESFNRGRYVVQSKLGWGTFSTVWLAWDTQLNRYVALKITKGTARFREYANREIRFLKAIAKGDPEDNECVVKLLDNFIHSGPNGHHVCLVLELLGDDLRTLLKHYNGKGIPLHMVKEICFHVLRGLDYLHRRLSIIHTDLKPENILLLSTIDPKKYPKKIGIPLKKDKSAIAASSSSVSSICMTGNQQTRLKEKGILVDQDCGKAANDEDEKLGVEAQGVKKKTWGNFKSLYDALDGKPLQRKRATVSPSEKRKLLESLDLKCKIADLGNACEITKQYTSHIQTLNYRCPETLLHSPYSTPADIWSVACIAFELATGAFLFNPQGKNSEDIVVDHLGLMMELLGVIPKEIALGGKLYAKFFDENGNLKGYRRLQCRPLINVLQESFGFSAKDADDFNDFLLLLLDFEPKDRPTAMQAILHPWLTGGPPLLQPSSSQENEEIIPQDNTTV
ncbi:uncharacterized protein LOC131068288 [Cryptomeria japonica]|uniref:uncharacterized protein LOC131068288 n=1 Tax=Cryptomeria japonica TaxID=3369 RepID=UPI0027DA298B|nr:uncharacterized protein LOC131068288 [Cryptomeria japonica]